jgi:hypothetical protein
MYDTEEILDGARAIRPHLETLIGEEANRVDCELSELLAEAQVGQRVTTHVLHVLARHEVTRKWLADYVKEKKDQQDEANRLKSFDLLVGNHTPLPLPLFRCPQGDYDWPRPAVGIPVPECPNHHIPLVQVPKSGE